MTGTPEREVQKSEQVQPPKRPRKPVIVRIFHAFKRQKNKNRSRGEKDQTQHQINERMMAQWTRRLGTFTFFMALIAGITAWILYETDQTARNAARAYLISNELTIETIRTKEGEISRWIISPIIENGGSTSTVNATNVTGLKALEAQMTETREIVVLDKKDTRHFVLRPRSKSSKIVAPMHITPESLPALRSGNPRTFVLGEVNYDDVYAAPHVTRFCYFLWAYPENIR